MNAHRRDTLRIVRDAGLVVKRLVLRNSGHLRIYVDDQIYLTTAATPSDHRWRDNLKADLNRVKKQLKEKRHAPGMEEPH